MDNTVSTSQIGNIASNITRGWCSTQSINPAQTVSLASMMPKPGKVYQSFTESSYDRPTLYRNLMMGKMRIKNFYPELTTKTITGPVNWEKWL
jgi:hypothetical protein